MGKRKIRSDSVRGVLLLILAYSADTLGSLSYSSVYSSLRGYGYRHKSVVDVVRQMLKDGEVTIENETVTLAEAGEKLLKELAIIRKHKGKWDGWWRLVIFDLPEKKRLLRDQLRELLIRLGMGKWQESVYLTPHPVMDEVNGFLREKGLQQQVVCLEAKRLGVASERELVERVFGTREKHKELRELVQMGEKLASDFDDGRLAEWCHRVYEWYRNDPGLPDQLVPKGWLETRRRLAKLKVSLGLVNPL